MIIHCRICLFSLYYGLVCFSLKVILSFQHPGSEEIMLEHAGADATVAFESKGHSKYAEELLAKYCIGVLNPVSHHCLILLLT